MKLASAFLRKKKIFIQGSSQTTAGVWIASSSVHLFNEDANTKEIGNAIIDVVNSSIQGIPHPKQAEWKNTQAPILNVAGVKTWSTFAKGTKAVGIIYEDGTVTMAPSFEYESHGGTSQKETNIKCSFSNEELGETLLKAFNICK